MPSSRLDRQDPYLGVTRPEILRDAEQHAVSVRQHLRPTMPLLPACRIWRSHCFALSAVLQDPRQAPSPETTQVDIAVRAPCSPCCAVGDGHDLDHRSALDRNFLYRGGGNEPYPLPIRRELLLDIVEFRLDDRNRLAIAHQWHRPDIRLRLRVEHGVQQRPPVGRPVVRDDVLRVGQEHLLGRRAVDRFLEDGGRPAQGPECDATPVR